ncbi:MAG: GNAT family N-acetyltransferase [Thaumarchaeota archaeon]|nr:GNAT family N-acetyltransferase [Nitrososphaerota archaeon]MCL5318031.1 GNAT family N-acetyltransferase [Nitrososphaerota archaeon]
MTKSTVDERWRQFEDNENSWFSFWSEAKDIGYALLLINEALADDPLPNHATRINCSTEAVAELLDRVVLEYQTRNIRPCIFISPLTHPQNLKTTLQDIGFRERNQLHVMEFAGADRIKTPEPSNMIVQRIGAELLDLWIQIFAESFMVIPPQIKEYSARAQHLPLDGEVELFIASLSGEPAGCAALYSKNGVGGVYSVGTLPKFRRRGVATALLKTVVQRSKALGNNSTILQVFSEEGPVTLYRHNGFELRYSKNIYILR